MAKKNINRVVIEGELLADPLPLEGRCRLRLLVLTLQKQPPEEEGGAPTWVGRRNEFDVLVWGAEAERCVAGLRAGASVAVEGRLEWIPGTDGIEQRIFARTEIVADEVRFLAEKATPAPEVGAEPEPEAEAAGQHEEAAAA